MLLTPKAQTIPQALLVWQEILIHPNTVETRPILKNPTFFSRNMPSGKKDVFWSRSISEWWQVVWPQYHGTCTVSRNVLVLWLPVQKGSTIKTQFNEVHFMFHPAGAGAGIKSFNLWGNEWDFRLFNAWYQAFPDKQLQRERESMWRSDSFHFGSGWTKRQVHLCWRLFCSGLRTRNGCTCAKNSRRGLNFFCTGFSCNVNLIDDDFTQTPIVQLGIVLINESDGVRHGQGSCLGLAANGRNRHTPLSNLHTSCEKKNFRMPSFLCHFQQKEASSYQHRITFSALCPLILFPALRFSDRLW